MKILAREKPLRKLPQRGESLLLQDEVAGVISLLQKGVLREIYFNEKSEAILVLEAASKKEAKGFLTNLPLVKGRYISFEMMELRPYTGFSRLLR